MQALVETGKEDKFQPSEKNHAVQVIRRHPWHPFFFAKIRKKKKSQSRDHFSALHVAINLVGMERSLDVDLFL